MVFEDGSESVIDTGDFIDYREAAYSQHEVQQRMRQFLDALCFMLMLEDHPLILPANILMHEGGMKIADFSDCGRCG